MKESEAKKLIGKDIEWIEDICPVRGGYVRSGVLVDVKGKNALVDYCGTNDWKWLPKMLCLRLKHGESFGDGKDVS